VAIEKRQNPKCRARRDHDSNFLWPVTQPRFQFFAVCEFRHRRASS
jgi:hypothetical protein